jgi:hypothetical protein
MSIERNAYGADELVVKTNAAGLQYFSPRCALELLTGLQNLKPKLEDLSTRVDVVHGERVVHVDIKDDTLQGGVPRRFTLSRAAYEKLKTEIAKDFKG